MGSLCQTAPQEEKALEIKIPEKVTVSETATKILTTEDMKKIYELMYQYAYNDSKESLTNIQKERAKTIKLVPETKNYGEYIRLLESTKQINDNFLKQAETRALQDTKCNPKAFELTKTKSNLKELESFGRDKVVEIVTEALKKDHDENKISDADMVNNSNEVRLDYGKAEDYLRDLPSLNLQITEKCTWLDNFDKKFIIASDYGFDNLKWSKVKFQAFYIAFVRDSE